MSAPPTRRPLRQRLLSHEFLGLLLAAALAGCGGGHEDDTVTTADTTPLAATSAAVDPVSTEPQPAETYAMRDPDGANAAVSVDTGPALEAVSVTATVTPESSATLAAAPPAVEDTEPAATADTVAEAA